MRMQTRSMKRALAEQRGAQGSSLPTPTPLSQLSTNRTVPLRRSARLKALAYTADDSEDTSPSIEASRDLPIDLISLAASFASTGKDITNICVALGPTSTTSIIRVDYLYCNSGYVLRTLAAYINSDRSDFDKGKCRTRLYSWLDVNPFCLVHAYTPELMERDSVASYFDEEGRRMVHYSAFQPFNNPAVAIELGMVNVLHYLVHRVGIDVNAYKWTGFDSTDRCHLLYLAMLQEDPSSFNFLVTDRTVNVDSIIHDANAGQKLIYAGVLDDEISPRRLEALVQHPSCDSNTPYRTICPLHCAVHEIEDATTPGDVIYCIEKMKILLRAGADPSLTTDGTVSPITVVRILLSRQGPHYIKSERGRLWKKILNMMEESAHTNVVNNND